MRWCLAYGLFDPERRDTVAPMTNTPGPLLQRTVAEIRAELGRQRHSGRWLADQIGAPSGTVARWLADETSAPLDALYAMCNVLNISVADIVGAALASGDIQPIVPLRARRPRRPEPDTGSESVRDSHRKVALAA